MQDWTRQQQQPQGYGGYPPYQHTQQQQQHQQAMYGPSSSSQVPPPPPFSQNTNGPSVGMDQHRQYHHPPVSTSMPPAGWSLGRGNSSTSVQGLSSFPQQHQQHRLVPPHHYLQQQQQQQPINNGRLLMPNPQHQHQGAVPFQDRQQQQQRRNPHLSFEYRRPNHPTVTATTNSNSRHRSHHQQQQQQRRSPPPVIRQQQQQRQHQKPAPLPPPMSKQSQLERKSPPPPPHLSHQQPHQQAPPTAVPLVQQTKPERNSPLDDPRNIQPLKPPKSAERKRQLPPTKEENRHQKRARKKAQKRLELQQQRRQRRHQKHRLEALTAQLQGMVQEYERNTLRDDNDGDDFSSNPFLYNGGLKEVCEQLEECLMPVDQSTKTNGGSNNKKQLEESARTRDMMLRRAKQIIAEYEASNNPNIPKEEDVGVLDLTMSESSDDASQEKNTGQISASNIANNQTTVSASEHHPPTHAKEQAETTDSKATSDGDEEEEETETLKEKDEQAVADKQKALSEARAKLQRLKLQKRLAAKKIELARLKNKASKVDVLPPIQALRKGNRDALLIIKGISSSGPPEEVYFVKTKLLINASDDSGDDDNDRKETGKSGKDSAASPELLDIMELIERKMALQKRLVETKEKLQHIGASETVHEPTVVPLPSTREGLLKRRKEAERNRAMTHYKHLVSKQQILLEKQRTETNKTQISLGKTEREISSLQVDLPKLRKRVSTLDAKKHILDDMLAEKLEELVNLRKKAHEHKLVSP